MKQVLIFANGDANDGPMVQQTLAAALDANVIAADGGARLARRFGCIVDTVIGDMDSLETGELHDLAADQVQILRYPPEKDETDLELALNYAAHLDADWIRVIGGVGNRLDQTLSNVYLMALPNLRGRDVRLVSGNQEAFLLLPGDWQIEGAPGDTLSLVPLGGAVEHIETDQLRYPLRGETLAFGPARGVSNVMQAGTARIQFETGILLVVRTLGRA
ncbi:MAG: thiamine diphosphokinase [Anaerolineaceae bacterium]|nr:thiamine diphosphokinase [Anaerolineaceae bacterium]